MTVCITFYLTDILPDNVIVEEVFVHSYQPFDEKGFTGLARMYETPFQIFGRFHEAIMMSKPSAFNRIFCIVRLEYGTVNGIRGKYKYIVKIHA